MMQTIIKSHEFVNEVLTALTESFGDHLLMGRVVWKVDRVSGFVEVDGWTGGFLRGFWRPSESGIASQWMRDGLFGDDCSRRCRGTTIEDVDVRFFFIGLSVRILSSLITLVGDEDRYKDQTNSECARTQGVNEAEAPLLWLNHFGDLLLGDGHELEVGECWTGDSSFS